MRFKLILIFFIVGMMEIPVVSQNLLRYEQCTNCPSSTGSMNVPTNGFVYSGSILQLTPPHIASDFGRRGSNSLWHLGVDVSSQGADDDVGDRIYPIETGTIIRVKGDGTYKVLVIEGVNRFGYGHIFFNETPDPSLGSRSGDFILKRMNEPQNNFYAIIYAPNNSAVTAIGEVAGTVSHPNLNNGLPITVSTSVNSLNTPVAPIGNSGNATGAAHIHLYNFQNDPVDNDFNSAYPTGYDLTSFRNPKNPLQFLSYSEPTYILSFPAGVNAKYPGTNKGSIQVRVSMFNETGGSYSNSIMDVEDVEVFIKPKHKPFTSFKYFEGPILESKISLGGRLNSNRYPSAGFPAHNMGVTAIDIAKGIRTNDEGIGSINRTGIVPYAYNNQPYDDYFFSDIYFGIRKDDVAGTTPTKFSRISEESRYPDGEYEVYSRVRTINDRYHNSQFIDLIIDNFRPYIKEVIVRKNSELGRLVYRGFWQWNSSTSQLSFIPETFDDAGPLDNIWIKVITSEPAKDVKINIESQGADYIDVDESLPDTNDTEFVLLFNRITTSGAQNIRIMANDLAGNPLQSNPMQIPIKQANGSWNPVPITTQIDQNHRFNTGSSTCTNGSGGRMASTNKILSTGCLYADFSVNNGLPELNESISLNPVTSGSGILSYLWDFGNGAMPSTSTSAGIQNVVYNTSGTKTVSLKICDNNGNCITETKTGIITVGAPPSELAVDFTADRLGGNIGDNIRLTSTVTGAVGNVSYSWSFGEGLSLGQFSDANPLIAYNTPGNKTIQLTVTDANKSVTVVKNNFFQINSNIFNVGVTIAGCGPTTSSGYASLSGFVTGGNGPPYDSYSWDFGDGTPLQNTGQHTYKKSGKYTVRLTVCDETSCGTAESVDCVVVPTVVDATSLTPDYLVNDLSRFGGIKEVGLNTPVKFVDATKGGGDPSTFKYSWKLDYDLYTNQNGNNAIPNVFYSTGPKPVEVVYTKTGNKGVILSVTNSSVARQTNPMEPLTVVAGRGPGACYANIGEVTISSTCWTANSKPKFTIPVAATNCPIAKTEVIHWVNEGNGIPLPNGVLDFSNYAPSDIPTFPFTSDFSFTVYQFDGVNYNPIGYKRQRFTIYGPVQSDAGIDKQVCLGGSTMLGPAEATDKIYKWTSSSGSPIGLVSDVLIANPVFNAVQKGTFKYKLTVTDPGSGCSSIDEVVLTVDRPEVSSSPFYARLAVATPLSFTTSGGFGENQFLWSPADKLTATNVSNPTFNSTTEGDYNYLVTVTDKMGCNGSGQVFVNASSSPANLIAKAESFTRISLTWIDRTPNETSFIIQRSIDGSTFVNYSSVGPNIQQFNDLDVQSGKIYSYRVAAKIGSATSGFSNEASAQTGSLPNFSIKEEVGSVAFADLDNDLDIDQIKLVYGSNVTSSTVQVLLNEQGTFLNNQTITLPNRKLYKALVVDFDNDNDLDVYLCGNSQLWQNGGSEFLLVNNNRVFQLTTISTESLFSYFIPNDFDLDGDIDLIGYRLKSENRNVLLKNNSFGSFDNILLTIDDYDNSSRFFDAEMDMNDYDNDGDEDLLSRSGNDGQLYLYLNNAGFSPSNRKSLLCCGEFYLSSADVNSDKKIDISQIGRSYNYAGILLNQGSTNFQTGNELSNIKSGYSRFGDINMDGQLDYFISGVKDNNLTSQVFLNEGTATSMYQSFNLLLDKLFDVDADGDLDIITEVNNGYGVDFGLGGYLMKNNFGDNLNKKNSVPTAPKDLCVYFNRNQVTFSWSPASDSETLPDGLTYNIYVKQNGRFIISPLSDVVTGFRRVQKKGNVDQNLSWTIDLPGSGAIEWGVQAVDNCYMGSPFAKNTTETLKTACDIISSNLTVDGKDIFTPQGCSMSTAIVKNGATLKLQAGNSIRLLPGFKVEPGSYLLASLTNYTDEYSPCVVTAGRDVADDGQSTDSNEGIQVSVYPNPNQGVFNLAIISDFPLERIDVEIVNLNGVKKLSRTYQNVGSEVNDQVDISNLTPGIYLLRVLTDEKTVLKKILKL